MAGKNNPEAAPSQSASLDRAEVARVLEALIRSSDLVRKPHLESARDELILQFRREAQVLIAEHVKPKTLRVQVGDRVQEVDGLVHEAFEDVLALAAMRLAVLMIGPTGCGKSHLAEQIARALGLPFYFINCTAGMSEGQLRGRLIPIGEGGRFEYVRSDFVRAYEEGGVFLMDEVDAADSNAMLTLNTALANGVLALPERPDKPMAKKHKDFVLIASANTHGTGANRLYVGRNQLDDATLDRFRIGQIEMDYDRGLEQRLIDDRKWLDRVWRVRDAANRSQLRRSVSTRFAIYGHRMIQGAKWTHDKCMRQLIRGWSADEISKVGLGGVCG